MSRDLRVDKLDLIVTDCIFMQASSERCRAASMITFALGRRRVIHADEIYEGPRDNRTVFLGNSNAEDLQAYIGRNPGKRMLFVVERARLERLRTLLTEAARATLTIRNDTNNKSIIDHPLVQRLPGHTNAR